MLDVTLAKMLHVKLSRFPVRQFGRISFTIERMALELILLGSILFSSDYVSLESNLCVSTFRLRVPAFPNKQTCSKRVGYLLTWILHQTPSGRRGNRTHQSRGRSSHVYAKGCGIYSSTPPGPNSERYTTTAAYPAQAPDVRFRLRRPSSIVSGKSGLPRHFLFQPNAHFVVRKLFAKGAKALEVLEGLDTLAKEC